MSKWKKVKLGDVCSLYQPKTIPMKELKDDMPYYVYGANGIIGKYHSYNHIDSEIAIACRGATCGTVNITLPKSWITGNAMVAHIESNELSFKYLFYALSNANMKNVITGAAQPQITRSNLKDLEIPLPAMEEQKKIAARLDAVSDLLAKQKQLLSEQDNLIQSTFYDMFGDLKCEESTIGSECILKSGTTFSKDDELDKGEYIYAKVADMNLQGNEVYIKTSRKYLSKKHVGNLFLNKGSIIFPKRGGAIRTNKKRILIEDSCVDLNIMGVSPRKKLTTQYLYVYFLNLNLESLCDGCVIPQINNKNIAPLKIPVPPLELQEKFAAIVKQIESEKSKIKSTIAETQTLFNALMAEYFED